MARHLDLCTLLLTMAACTTGSSAVPDVAAPATNVPATADPVAEPSGARPTLASLLPASVNGVPARVADPTMGGLRQAPSGMASASYTMTSGEPHIVNISVYSEMLSTVQGQFVTDRSGALAKRPGRVGSLETVDGIQVHVEFDSQLKTEHAAFLVADAVGGLVRIDGAPAGEALKVVRQMDMAAFKRFATSMPAKLSRASSLLLLPNTLEGRSRSVAVDEPGRIGIKYAGRGESAPTMIVELSTNDLADAQTMTLVTHDGEVVKKGPMTFTGHQIGGYLVQSYHHAEQDMHGADFVIANALHVSILPLGGAPGNELDVIRALDLKALEGFAKRL